jgi:hypothetical protein
MGGDIDDYVDAFVNVNASRVKIKNFILEHKIPNIEELMDKPVIDSEQDDSITKAELGYLRVVSFKLIRLLLPVSAQLREISTNKLEPYPPNMNIEMAYQILKTEEDNMSTVLSAIFTILDFVDERVPDDVPLPVDSFTSDVSDSAGNIVARTDDKLDIISAKQKLSRADRRAIAKSMPKSIKNEILKAYNKAKEGVEEDATVRCIL